MWRAVERWGSQIKSGLNFDFLSRLFGKQKTYTQFESTEDIFSDAKEELASDDEDDVILMRDRDPYEVTYERRKTKVKGYGASSDYDIKINTNLAGERVNGDQSVHCDTDCTVAQANSVRHTSSGHQRQGSTVREDVGDFVNSVFQKQYKKLENDATDDNNVNETHDQDHIDGATCDNAKGDKSLVFNSIKDVNPNWKEKKPKRRKKVRVFQFLRRITSLTSRDTAYGRTK